MMLHGVEKGELGPDKQRLQSRGIYNFYIISESIVS